MDTMFVILLLTGLCVPSASFPYVYYFIREEMTWDDAQNYCISEYTDMAPVLYEENVTTMMNAPAGGYSHKAWIGLYGDITDWAWVDGQPVTYYNWEDEQPDTTDTTDGFCVGMTSSGTWRTYSCTEKKAAVCFNGTGQTPFFAKEQMTWMGAKKYCENQSSILATVADEKANSGIQRELSAEEAWIGFSRSKLWYWTYTGDTEESYTFTNWKPGQPNNMNLERSCVTTIMKDGTWTDEGCDAAYPFFCYGIFKSRKTVVRITIQSSANMEDLDYSTDLQQQLFATFVNQGLTDFKLTWKKLPVKQT